MAHQYRVHRLDFPDLVDPPNQYQSSMDNRDKLEPYSASNQCLLGYHFEDRISAARKQRVRYAKPPRHLTGYPFLTGA